MSNRSQRRAQRRRPPVQLAELRMSVTPDEAVILEEALTWWIHQTELDLPEERHPIQQWSLQRAEKIRQALEAALADRPWRDLAPERDAPGESDATAAESANRL